MSKVTKSDPFKDSIQNYLNNRAATDELFAETLKKESKNIDDCVNYIYNEVQKSGRKGFTDEEVFCMAVHYYDEDDIKGGKKVNATVVVNHHVELTADEIQEAKDRAIKKVENEEREKLLKKSTPKKVKDPVVKKEEEAQAPQEKKQVSLF